VEGGGPVYTSISHLDSIGFAVGSRRAGKGSLRIVKMNTSENI
jgi:transcriptional regulator CtsR